MQKQTARQGWCVPPPPLSRKMCNAGPAARSYLKYLTDSDKYTIFTR